MRISIIGAGYVGLVTGACLAEKGHFVYCVDQNAERVDQINRGVSPLYEEGLTEILQHRSGDTLLATTEFERAVNDSDVTLIAVGTPFDGREIDLSQIEQASLQIGEALARKAGYHTVVVKSTVIPGTTDRVVSTLLESASGKKAGMDFGVGANPEFLTEGQAVDDFMNPDRIVLGANEATTMARLEDIYSAFAGTPVVKTNCKTAEMIKYASNSLLATQISFANEIANLCSATGGVDATEVMKGVHLSHYLRPWVDGERRVQAPISSFLEAGCGFGGSCLPKDVKALIAFGEKSGAAMDLLGSVITINQGQAQRMIGLLKKHFSSLRDVPITILGLSFKPDTDDMRESPAITIIRLLADEGARITAHDPVAIPAARAILGDGPVTFEEDLEQAMEGAAAVVLITRWEQYRQAPGILAASNPEAVFVDGRRMLDKNDFAHYEGIGL